MIMAFCSFFYQCLKRNKFLSDGAILELRLPTQQNPLSHKTYTFNWMIIHTFSLRTLLCWRCRTDLLGDGSKLYRASCFVWYRNWQTCIAWDKGLREEVVRGVSCPGKIKNCPWFCSNSYMMFIKFWQFDSLFKKVYFLQSIFQILGADACNKSQCKLFLDQVKCCIMLKLLKKK